MLSAIEVTLKQNEFSWIARAFDILVLDKTIQIAWLLL
jgi:hypothetical protein